jgi:hypothetical protein
MSAVSSPRPCLAVTPTVSICENIPPLFRAWDCWEVDPKPDSLQALPMMYHREGVNSIGENPIAVCYW